MGVNMAGNCIFDDEAVCAAARQEVIRRYFAARCQERKGMDDGKSASKIQLLMKNCGITADERRPVAAANALARQTGEPALAVELPDGRIVTGKTSQLLGAASAMLLNALKALGGIDDAVKLISPEVIQPVQHLKVDYLGNQNPRLHTDEVLVALSICAASDPAAEKAMQQLEKLGAVRSTPRSSSQPWTRTSSAAWG